MKSLRFCIRRIYDFGTIVSLVGKDAETDLPVTLHVDHRPFQAFWDAWAAAGYPHPIEYDAGNLTLSLRPVARGGGDGA